MADTLRNGEVWRQREFPHHERVAQYIGDGSPDEWMLMGIFPSRHGGMAMCPATDRNGKNRYTEAEAFEHLTRLKYTATGKDFVGNELNPVQS